MPQEPSQKKSRSRKHAPIPRPVGLPVAERRIEKAARSGARSLDLSRLSLTSLPESLCQLTHLQSLDISENLLVALPESLSQLVELEQLFGFSNKLGWVPEALSQLTRLHTLNVHNNRIIELPNSLCLLKELEFLDVSQNWLRDVPTWMGNLTKLQYLDLGRNFLCTLPESLGHLSRLKYLVVSENQLRVLPSVLHELIELEALDISFNVLSSLPESFHWPARLRYLFAHSNALESLPSSLRAPLTALEVLDLNGNDGLGIPPEILGPHAYSKRWDYSPFSITVEPAPTLPAAIVDYYFRVRQGRRPLNEAKLILVGRGGVGKTCLIKRMLLDTFNEREPETPGIEIQQWPVTLSEGDTVRLHVWDFGGQEILHATHQFFLTERTIYLLVLSGREGNPTQDAEYWLQLIRSFGGDSQVIIALNKTIQHPFDVNRGLLLEKYPMIAGFVSTDCKDASGIQDLKSLILRKTENLEHRKMGFPADWFAIKERLAGMRENFVTWDRYQEICRELGEENPDEQRLLATFLHILGIALNYRDDPRLKETHVLNPRWVTEGIYSLLRVGQKQWRDGVLTKAELATVLDAQHYPVSHHSFLLHLMEKFQLCFRLLGKDERYLVPELLGENQPDLRELLAAQGLGFRYQYEVLPEGLLPRFIVQTHAYSEEGPRWRTGVILKHEGCLAVVRADSRERRVDIHITGNKAHRRGLLAIIREKFGEQHRELKGLVVDERVPIPSEPSVTVSYKHLLVLEEEEEQLYRPEGSRQKVSVVELLDGVESFERRTELRGMKIADAQPALRDRGVRASKERRAPIPLSAGVTIGIITALPKEFAAMRVMMHDCQEYHVPGSGAGRRYMLGRMKARDGKEHRVALAMLPKMGNNIAATRATLLLEHFPSMEAIIMVGIAGAVPAPQKPEDHVRLGDIVVSDIRGVVQYDMVKLEEIRSSTVPPSAKLVEAVRHLQAEEIAGHRPWDEHIDAILKRLGHKRPPQTADKLFATDAPGEQLKHPKDLKRQAGRPRVFQGPIASANELLKRPAKRDELCQRFRAKAVEMEGSGIADATWNHDKGYLVVRGTCDYCDSHKNDDWQEYAAAVAAGYTRALIESSFASVSPSE
jgi:internalin A